MMLLMLVVAFPMMPSSTPAEAAGSASQPIRKGLLNLDQRRLAVRGYDVVSYFEAGEAQLGDRAHQVRWRGGLFRFTSASHAAMFRADPTRYAPRFGGYCAWAVSQGYVADADPLQWAIIEGRLYLNYDAKISARFAADAEQLIEKAGANWPRVVE